MSVEESKVVIRTTNRSKWCREMLKGLLSRLTHAVLREIDHLNYSSIHVDCLFCIPNYNIICLEELALGIWCCLH